MKNEAKLADYPELKFIEGENRLVILKGTFSCFISHLQPFSPLPKSSLLLSYPHYYYNLLTFIFIIAPIIN